MHYFGNTFWSKSVGIEPTSPNGTGYSTTITNPAYKKYIITTHHNKSTVGIQPTPSAIYGKRASQLTPYKLI